MRRQRRLRSRRNGQDLPRPPATSTTSYKGMIPTRTAENGITAILRDVDSFDTGGGTSIVGIVDNNPSAADNWTSYADAWGEYRVLGIRLEYQPLYSVNTAIITSAPIVHCVVHQGSLTSPTDYLEAYSYGDPKITNSTRSFVREWRMTNVNESTWVPTGSPTGTSLALLFAAFDLTTGTTYGQLFINYVIQFRNAQ